MQLLASEKLVQYFARKNGKRMSINSSGAPELM
jgi:hypothetical protein